MSIFSSNSNYPIGLDISDLSLKVVQLNKRDGDIGIQAIGKKELPEGLIEHGEIKDKNGLVNAINELLSRPDYGQITSSEVVTCLPETRTFVKLVTIEKTINPLAAIIEAEMEKYIPIDSNEMYYDWQIIEESSSSQSILIGASPKNLVDQYTSLLNESGLNPIALEIEPISICRSILLEEAPDAAPSDRNYCIFDLGAARSSILFYSRDTILFTLSIPISGDDINKKIADYLKLDYTQAERAKIVCGLDDENADGVVKKIIKDLAGNITSKIIDSFAFYNERFADRGPINQILLSGGGASISGLQKFIQDKTGIETAVGNSLNHIHLTDEEYKSIFSPDDEKNDQIEQAQNSYPNYATAFGLALRGIFGDDY